MAVMGNVPYSIPILTRWLFILIGMVVDTFANMTRQISMIPWLIRDVQVVVAMVTRSVISCSEQFSAVQHVEMITIFFCYNLLRLFPQCLHFTNTIGLQILRG